MLRRTKIVTTLGPSTDKEGVLENIIAAGANMVRMNFSHGTIEDHIKRAEQVHILAKKLDTHVAIMGDLQGPKIRVSTFANNKIILEQGAQFILDSDLPTGAGDEQQVGLDYKSLPEEVEPGDLLLLDDGRVQLEVTSIDGNKVYTKVVIAGPLSNNKGINKKGGGLSAAALTEKDKVDIKVAAQINVDYLAVSFPRSAADLDYARQLAKEAGFHPQIVAKVERAETVATIEAMDEIIMASDAVMVARGDLGVEIGDPELVGVQKTLIRRTRKFNRVVITATQMMESMISSPMPTRAEVMDVANAVLDGTDAVMLSGETAAGDYPVETVEAMANVCVGAEKHPSINVSNNRMDYTFSDVNEAVAMATMFAANHLTGVKAIVSLSNSGITPLQLSRLSSGLPIFAMSRHKATLNRACLYRGVTPIHFDFSDVDILKVARRAIELLKSKAYLKEGDIILLTHGDAHEGKGGTNTCKILHVE